MTEPTPPRADLHCHSDASNRTAEAALNAIACPECYSRPAEVYAQARRRGMDFVTLTDHDVIDGAESIAALDGMLVGEELSCWFPEDSCKMHVLLWGIDRAQHVALQSRARDIYAVAEYVERHRIAHAVAHPIYRQNDRLERWHLERLLLLFKGFECLNGAHSPLHREAFEPLLNRLSETSLAKLSARHNLAPRWPEPWKKARTAGSDDHGLLNVGRTWTEFPLGTATADDVLECLRAGRCAPGGEAGSSAKLAHTFYSVAVRYYSRHLLQPVAKPNFTTSILQSIVGERPAPTRAQLAKVAVKHRLQKITGRVLAPFRAPVKPPSLLKKLFLQSSLSRLKEFSALRDAIDRGLPPLGEHEAMFDFVSRIDRDVTRGIAAAIDRSIDDASFTDLFDAIAAVLGQQFVMLPYYFALFHQNKERHLLRGLTGLDHAADPRGIKVGLFTDTLDEVNGVGRFLRTMGSEAHRNGFGLTVHTCSASPRSDAPWRKNFEPTLSRPMPFYPGLDLALPPVREVLEWADRQQFDAIHISTPGPMGLCGWVAAKMLRVPIVGTYHTDFPAYLDRYTGDHRVTNGAAAYMTWLYTQMATVFSRSRPYLFKLRDLGVRDDRLAVLPPCVDAATFNPRRRDPLLWARLGVTRPRVLLYCGRVSAEKNLSVLAAAFERLCAARANVALVVAGDGPYLAEMRTRLAPLPAHFLGTQDDAALASLYASADIFAFPSRTDTLGQVVTEAAACGLPAVVANEGGPRETVEHEVTGLLLPGAAGSDDWAAALARLLDDEPLRQRLGRAAAAKAARFSADKTFAAFWSAHVAAMASDALDDADVAAPVAHRR